MAPSDPGPRRRAKRLAGGAIGIAASAYLSVAAYVFWKQESLIFHPVPLPADHRFELPDTEEVKIPVPGASLSALHLKLQNPKGVVFFLHGNSGNLQSWLTSIDFYRRANFDLFMLDYRGFGKSTGYPEGEAQLHADVRAAWDSIAARYAGKKIVVYGRSLGTGLAARLATDIQPDLTILVSPYLSLEAMARERYPWLPSFINRYPMQSDQWVGHIRNPVLITHGDRDTVIPIAQGAALAKMRAGIEWVPIPGAAHNDIHRFPFYLETLERRLASL